MSVKIIDRGALRFRIYTQKRKAPRSNRQSAIGNRQYTAHTLSYRLNGRRHRVVRAARADIDLAIEAAEIAIANNQTALLDFSEADRQLLTRLRQIASVTSVASVPLEVLMSEAVEARLRNSRAKIVDKDCPGLVEDLLAQPRKRKRGQKWGRALRAMLDRLAEFWTGPVHLLRPVDANRWLDALPGGLDYRHHHRAALLQLARFAVARNHAPREWFDELQKNIEDQGRAEVTIRVWTPDQLVRLLAHTRANMIPFSTLQSFAGIRHEELNPEAFALADKRPLDWADFDWEQGHVEIGAETGKTGARIVPLSENLVEWLKPYHKARGPVCTVRNTGHALTAAKRRAGLPAGRNESRNVLRKSFGSYRLAVVKHIGQVADEMGNSPAKIKSNYRKPRPEREGKRWFDIWPTTAEILQLNFAGV